MKVYIEKGEDAYKTTKKLLKKINFKVENKKVLIKPNVTTSDSAQSGITTDVNVVRAILERLKNCKIIIGEGSVSDTIRAFEVNGYSEVAKEFNARLVDLNKDEIVRKKISKSFRFKELPFAKTVFECDYLINVAKLKTHSLSLVTLCLKNLFGTVVPRRNRVIVHPSINKGICDIAQIVHPDFNFIDGIIGNQLDEVISDPVNSGIIIGGDDALAVDLVASLCMGIDPSQVKHLILAQKLFGKREIEVIGEKIEDVVKQYKVGSLFATKVRYASEKILGYVFRILKP